MKPDWTCDMKIRADCGNTAEIGCPHGPLPPKLPWREQVKPCPDCESRKHHILGILMIFTVLVTAFILVDYTNKASSIEAYNNLSKECNMKIAEANKQIAKCRPCEEYGGAPFPIMNCSCGGD